MAAEGDPARWAVRGLFRFLRHSGPLGFGRCARYRDSRTRKGRQRPGNSCEVSHHPRAARASSSVRSSASRPWLPPAARSRTGLPERTSDAARPRLIGKQRLPRESTKCPVVLHQRNGGMKYPLFQPRKPLIKKLQEHLRGVHTKRFLQRRTWTVQAVEGKRSHASRLRHCLKTILRSQHSTEL